MYTLPHLILNWLVLSYPISEHYEKTRANFFGQPDIFTDKETQAYRVNTSASMSPGNFLKKKKTTTKTQCQNLKPKLVERQSLCFHPSPEKAGHVQFSLASCWCYQVIPPGCSHLSVTGLGEKRISRRTCSEEMSFSDLRRSQVLNPIFRSPAEVSRHWFVLVETQKCVIKVESVRVLESSWGGGTGKREGSGEAQILLCHAPKCELWPTRTTWPEVLV